MSRALTALMITKVMVSARATGILVSLVPLSARVLACAR